MKGIKMTENQFVQEAVHMDTSLRIRRQEIKMMAYIIHFV